MDRRLDPRYLVNLEAAVTNVAAPDWVATP
jgi:hypothetical protein